jgi:LysR family transcriptional regulator, glycine cleavage system transcriptional activator
MLTLPPLTELRAFEAAARHLSFKAAADELGVTPTAVSHQIRLLEQHCGQSLFRRRPRPLALTAAGERLFPVIRDGLAKFSIAFSSIRGDRTSPLRVTATNAFAGRWLVPRLPSWCKAHPGIALEVIGTDAVLDLGAGDADLAIRYARTPPPNLVAQQLFRDRFFAVCSPALLPHDRPIRRLADLKKYPLIECFWSPSDPEAPTWRRWEARARVAFRNRFEIGSADLSFREESHGIEAAIAGQGIALCSDILVGSELKSGKLIKLFDIALPGFGFYIVYRSSHPRRRAISAFVGWARSIDPIEPGAASYLLDT